MLTSIATDYDDDDDGWTKLHQGTMSVITSIKRPWPLCLLNCFGCISIQILLSEMMMRRKGGRRKHELFSHEARFSE